MRVVKTMACMPACLPASGDSGGILKVVSVFQRPWSRCLPGSCNTSTTMLVGVISDNARVVWHDSAVFFKHASPAGIVCARSKLSTVCSNTAASANENIGNSLSGAIEHRLIPVTACFPIYFRRFPRTLHALPCSSNNTVELELWVPHSTYQAIAFGAGYKWRCRNFETFVRFVFS